MRVAIIAGGTGWHVRDLQRAGVALGWSLSVLDFRELQAALECGVPASLTDQFDALIVRTMPLGSLEQVVFRMDVLHTLEQHGLPVVNGPRSLETCIDKYLTLVRLRHGGLPVPPTVVCQNTDQALEAFAFFGGDVVVKPLFGSEGRGMVRLTDAETAWRTFRTLERTESVLYVQQFIHHPGYDVRLFVLNQRVLTAMRRHGHGQWRTNVAQGATTEAFTPSAELVDLALRATAAVGAWVAGVDLLQNPDGTWFVLEVNAVPGWQALAPTTGVDVATALLRSLEQLRPRRVSNSASAAVSVAGEQAAFLACLWEATARKAGNVHPGAAFTDLTYADFVRSASAIAPIMADARGPLGETILRAVQATRQVVNSNTNLGIILLLAPLASVPLNDDLERGVASILANTTIADAERVYEAIRLAVPGGLGEAETQDVRDTPTQTLREVMTLAADRDLIAKQYASNFAGVFGFGVSHLQAAYATHGRLEPAIQELQLHFLATYPDSLIARKVGLEEAAEVQTRAASVLNLGGLTTTDGRNAYDELDRWLRTTGHQHNPGTTADLITACLYVGLRQGWLPATAIM